MNPEDVPDELLLVALSAWTGKSLDSLYDLIEVDGDEHTAMERTLRAVVSEIQRQERPNRRRSAVRRFTITIPGDVAEAIEFSSGVVVACWTDPARLYAWEDIKVLRDQMPDAEISWIDARGEAR